MLQELYADVVWCERASQGDPLCEVRASTRLGTSLPQALYRLLYRWSPWVARRPVVSPAVSRAPLALSPSIHCRHTLGHLKTSSVTFYITQNGSLERVVRVLCFAFSNRVVPIRRFENVHAARVKTHVELFQLHHDVPPYQRTLLIYKSSIFFYPLPAYIEQRLSIAAAL